MKVLLTGGTGLIGTEILYQLISSPVITSIILLSRRPIPDIEARDEKISVFVLENFLDYPQSLIEELTDVRAVFW